MVPLILGNPHIGVAINRRPQKGAQVFDTIFLVFSENGPVLNTHQKDVLGHGLGFRRVVSTECDLQSTCSLSP